jgi:acyl carrier protein
MGDSFEGIKAVIMDVMKISGENITEETRFIDDLKADSMDQFFLIDGFCEKFNLTISDEDARQIRTVTDVLKYIETHKN